MASRRKMRLILWLGGIAVCLLLGMFAIQSPLTIWRQPRVANRTQAIQNLKTLLPLLLEFEAEYGSYPSASTLRKVKEATGTPLTLDDSSSNKLLLQLLVVSSKEQPFHTQIAGARKPDEDFRDDRHALAPGECGFAYIPGLNSKSPPGAPVMMSPMIRGTKRFDREPFLGQAVILFANGVIQTFPIERSGEVKLGGKDVFDPSQPYWMGKAPDIKWQE